MNNVELYSLLEKVVNEKPGTITPETALSSLPGWDSLGVVMWIVEIDETIGVVLEASQITTCKTALDLAALLGDQIID
jgi:acyl carrier protein